MEQQTEEIKIAQKQKSIKTTKEYVLAYGFRRYTAFKKLGWKTIPCYIQKENKVKDLKLTDVYVIDNTRVSDSTDGFAELMQSIKQNGLLEPIGVWKSEDLTRIDFLITNLTENIHRKGLLPYELGKVIEELKSYGLNNKEIAVRLSLPVGRIESVSILSSKVSKEVMEEITFSDRDNHSNPAGKLSVGAVNRITMLRVSKTDMNKVINETKQKALSITDIDLIGNLANSGMAMSKAIKERNKYISINPRIIVKKDKLKEYGYENMKHVDLINAMLSGKLPLKKDMFFYDRTPVIKQSED